MDTPTFVNTDNSTLVTVALSVWSGRAKLTRDDLDPNVAAQLPPEQLAMLGQKKLVDPDLLKPIVAIKSKMFTMMNIMGVRIFGGWLVDDQLLPSVANDLDSLATDFNTLVADFLSNYQDSAHAWASQFPEWEQAILKALPSMEKLAGKFSFKFRAYKLAAVGTGATADDSQEQLQNLAGTAYQQIAEDLRAIYETTFASGRTTFNNRSFNALRKVADFINNLAFTDEAMARLSPFFLKTVDKYSALCKDELAMSEFRLLLKAMSDPVNLRDIAQGVSIDTDPASLINGVAGSSQVHSAPPEQEAAPAQQSESEPVAPSATPMSNPEPRQEPTKPAEPQTEQHSVQAAQNEAAQELFDLLGF